jgi:putative transposase
MRKVPLVTGEFYHLYNRGVDKRLVFTEETEYKRFLAYLYMLNNTEDINPSDFFRSHPIDEAFDIERGKQLIAIGAFCLMPNHFHLYVTPLVEGGVSKFMQKLQTAYTKYFNEKHKRTGSLFGGTFKSEHIENNNQAKYLFSYIHLNPAKLKDPKWNKKGFHNWKMLQTFVAAYPYSSYLEYSQKQPLITDPKPYPKYLKDTKDFYGHISDWLKAGS